MDQIYHHPTGKWFVYLDDRVLGPFNTYWEAVRERRIELRDPK